MLDERTLIVSDACQHRSLGATRLAFGAHIKQTV
jgi:hypothetical protein